MPVRRAFKPKAASSLQCIWLFVGTAADCHRLCVHSRYQPAGLNCIVIEEWPCKRIVVEVVVQEGLTARNAIDKYLSSYNKSCALLPIASTTANHNSQSQQPIATTNQMDSIAMLIHFLAPLQQQQQPLPSSQPTHLPTGPST
jgi:hypothetical protein